MHLWKNFIHGETVEAQDRGLIESFDPSTGKVWAKIQDSTADDMDRAIESAQQAFPSWSQSSLKKRVRLVEDIADLLEKNIETLAELESRDQGKTYSRSLSIELPRAIENMRFYASLVQHTTEMSCTMDDGSLNYTKRSPLGVVGLITPWNLPLYLLTWKLAPALLMGNTVVCKPSEMTSATAAKLGELLSEVDLPPGVCNIVLGRGNVAGKALVEDPRVKAISFTGGTETGKTIATQLAPTLRKSSLELGGKNPSIVFADADLDKALESVYRAGFSNQGEICLCGSRLIIEKSVAEQFVGRLVEKCQRTNVGDPFGSSTDMGALISGEHLQKVLDYCSKAESQGAKILTGGERVRPPGRNAEGYFMKPTVVEGLPSSAPINQEEIFGPVISVLTFENEAQALELSNDVPYGLSASLWTSDLNRAHRMSDALEVGMVWVNTWMKRDLRTPFGGSKESGLGREGGRWSLEFFSEVKNICMEIS